MKYRNKKIEKVLTVVFIIFFVLYLTCSLIINTKGLHLFFDSDMYADLILSKYMWNQKTIFPNGWTFGNQYYVLSTPVLMALLNGIFGNAFISLRIATAIMSILIFVSYIWMVKPFSSKISICAGLLLLISSIIGCEIGKQLEGQLFYLGASYYSLYLVSLLLTAGCFARIVNNIKCSKIIITIVLAINFCCGMQSLRQTAILILPLLLCSIIYRNKGGIVFAITNFIANISGLFLIKFLNVSHILIYGDSSIANPSEWLSRLLNGIDSIVKISGLRWLLKGNPIGLFGLFLIFIIVFSIFFSLKYKENRKLCPILLLLIFGIMATISACVFTNTNIRYVYLFSWFALVAVSGTTIVNTLVQNSKPMFIYLICAGIIFGSIANLLISYGYEIKQSLINDNSIEKEVGEYIEKNGYKYVYGEWVKLGKFMVYTNDKVIAGSWTKKPFNTINYLNPLDIYSEKDNSEAVYLLYDYETEEAIEISKKLNAELIKVAEFNNGEIQLYKSDKQLMHFENQ